MFCRNPGWARRTIAAGLAAAAIMASTFRLRAELPEWMRNVETASRWHEAIFRTVPTPSGPVEVRRSPADMYDALRRAPGPATHQQSLAVRPPAAAGNLRVI